MPVRANRLAGSGIASLMLLLLASLSPAPAVHAKESDLLARGRYLFGVAGCASCHTRDVPLAGGRPLETPFGTFYPPNITPDRDHGIGAWSEDDFRRALGMGISPAGADYFPAFPYTSYTRIRPDDVQALYTWLMQQPPSARANRPHALPWYLFSRRLVRDWKRGRFDPGPWEDDPARSAAWNRGAYLANALGHCAECHTPRGLLGGLQRDRHLSGTATGPEQRPVPNITMDPVTGIGAWTPREHDSFLATGQRPDGSYTGALMSEVLAASSMGLTPADRQALATYLRTLPPLHHDIHYRFDPFADREFHQ
ncbi:MAG: cytochrome c [Pseudomonadota bacterium]